jgi:dihydrofolate reductase
MRRLIATEFVTLDGVMEAPGHDQHRDGRNAWALAGADEDQQRFKIEELDAADALVFGRVTYDIWAAFWPSAPNDDGFADRMNSLPKYVVSHSLTEGPGTTRRSSARIRPGRSPNSSSNRAAAC